MKRATFVVAAVGIVASASACTIGGSQCDPGYDDHWVYADHCDGNVHTRSASACGETNTSVVEDCSATGRVCIERWTSCATLCQDDAACKAEDFCRKVPGGRSVCAPRLRSGTDCAGLESGCEQGLVCNTTNDPSRMACGPDCTKATGMHCADGATSMCLGDVVYACGACGIARPSTSCADLSTGAHQCAEANGAAVCALSTMPDPKCATASSYCDGSARVECTSGFSTRRIDCAPNRCVDGGDYAACDIR